jgi:serine/threonine protein kinase
MNNQIANARSIFISAIENYAPDQWDSFLNEACREDAALRCRVEHLLRAHQGDDSFLDRGDDDQLPTAIDEAIAEGPGTVIGPYKLVQQIGEGGFGVVFLAEQERPVKRRVALKVIKPGMDTRQVIARFEAERQALAMMDHPCIAKVYDAGTTAGQFGARGPGQGFGVQSSGFSGRQDDRAQGLGVSGGVEEAHCNQLNPDPRLLTSGPNPELRILNPVFGRPYFVMELVHGVPITEYCDQCNLATNERLELFIAVCQAVQHAHQKGVIHRDIKPTNVLVTMQDGRPAPKIIDFGVAKAINQQLTEHSLMTAFAQIVGTPLYMSPEQAELSPLGIDTRSDIYSLGVLLYELLTSTTPFDKDRLHAAAYDEFRRIIREEEPPRPSARISTLVAGLAVTIAERRRTDVRRLQQTVRGELDWIVMKCLEKDRNRRYDSAGSLARDVERYLHDEPVVACPPSMAYRFKKFVRRNRIAAAFVLLLLSAVAALTVSNIETRRNERRTITESAKAVAISDLFLAMLDSASPDQAKGSEYTVRDLLDTISVGLRDQLKGIPEAEATVRLTIGNAYRRLNLFQKAQPQLETALKLRREQFGDDHELVAESQVALAWNLDFQGKREQSEALVRESLRFYESHATAPQPFIYALWTLQCILNKDGQYDDAAKVAQQALDLAAERRAMDSPEVANILSNLANIRSGQKKYSEAEQLARQSLDLHRRVHGAQHPETGFAFRALGVALKAQGKFAEAKPAYEEALRIFRLQYGPHNSEHSAIANCIRDLKSVLESLGDKSALEALAKLEADTESGDNPSNHIRLAELLLSDEPADDKRHEKKEEASRQFRRAIEQYRQVPSEFANDFGRRMAAADGLTELLVTCSATPSFGGEIDAINQCLAAELPQLLAAFPDDNCKWQSAMCYKSWGWVLLSYGNDFPTSEHAFNKSIDLLKGFSVSDPTRRHLWIRLASSYADLGELRWRSGRPEDAEASLRAAIEIYEAHAAKIAADIVAEPQPWIEYDISFTYNRLALLLAASHREEEAAEFVRKGALVAKRITVPVELACALCYTALAQLRLGDETGYRATCKALVDVPLAGANDYTKVGPIWAWCFGPDALDDSSLPVKRAEEFAASNKLNQRHFPLMLLGAALYRAGKYEQAAECLEESIAAYPSESPPRGFDTINYQRLLLTMTKWQQGQRDAARKLFAKTQSDIDTELQSPSIVFHRRATLELLRHEADALLGKAPIDEAKQNETPSDSLSNP